MPENSRLKVLIIAEAANPEWTSVPLLGWSHAHALTKVCDVHLVTQIRNKDAIERFGWTEGREFTAIDSEKIALFLYTIDRWIRGNKGLGWTLATALNSLVYPYFEYLCWKKFRTALLAGHYDIVHRITPVSPTAPSPLARRLKKIGVPFVVGPLNGGVAWPAEFREMQNQEREWLNHVRSIYKILPGYRSMRRHSACIIAGSMATLAQLPEHCAHRALYLPENAIDPARFSMQNDSDYSLPLKAAFVGRLVPYKGADMAIEAMEPLLKAGKMRFDIYGTGPEEQRLAAMVREKDLQESVTLHGFVPNNELQQKLVQADLFVFPSVREFGGGVVLEAMALGVVPMIADYAGPAELVTEACGFKIPMGARAELIAGFRRALKALCDQPGILAAKRAAAMARINRYYTWDKKVEQDMQIYRWLLKMADKPDFRKPFV